MFSGDLFADQITNKMKNKEFIEYLSIEQMKYPMYYLLEESYPKKHNLFARYVQCHPWIINMETDEEKEAYYVLITAKTIYQIKKLGETLTDIPFLRNPFEISCVMIKGLPKVIEVITKYAIQGIYCHNLDHYYWFIEKEEL